MQPQVEEQDELVVTPCRCFQTLDQRTSPPASFAPASFARLPPSRLPPSRLPPSRLPCTYLAHTLHTYLAHIPRAQRMRCTPSTLPACCCSVLLRPPSSDRIPSVSSLARVESLNRLLGGVRQTLGWDAQRLTPASVRAKLDEALTPYTPDATQAQQRAARYTFIPALVGPEEGIGALSWRTGPCGFHALLRECVRPPKPGVRAHFSVSSSCYLLAPPLFLKVLPYCLPLYLAPLLHPSPSLTSIASLPLL